jgi:hypothetical protein
MAEPQSTPDPQKAPPEGPPQKPVWPSGSIQKEASEKSEEIDADKLIKIVEELLKKKKD